MSIPAEEQELRLPAGLLLVAFLGDDAIGCGALKFHGNEPAEIKRMWVAESALAWESAVDWRRARRGRP